MTNYTGFEMCNSAIIPSATKPERDGEIVHTVNEKTTLLEAKPE